MFNLFLGLLVAFIVTLMITGIFLMIKAYKLKLKNLYVLGTGFILVSLGFILSVVIQSSLSYFFEEIFVSSGFVLAVYFTNLTFHKNRETFARHIQIIIIILACVEIGFSLMDSIEKTPLNFYLSSIVDLIYTLLTFNWLAWSSYSAYKRVKDKKIMPWIKMRYKIIAFSSFILSLHVIPELFTPWNMDFIDKHNFAFGIAAIIAIIFAVGMFLAWIMPDWFKRYLNRDYEILEDTELTEEELLNMIKTQLSDRE